jgi:hypothetical protein
MSHLLVRSWALVGPDQSWLALKAWKNLEQVDYRFKLAGSHPISALSGGSSQ